MRNIQRLAPILILLSCVGCLHRAASTAPVTPYEQALVWNDTLAQTNESIARGIIGLSPSVIPAEKAGNILRFQRKVAQIDEQLSTILKEGQTYAQLNSTQVKSLLADLSTAAQNMIDSGAVGVKNPSTQNLFDADIANVKSLISNILNGLTASGVLQ